MVSDLQFPYLFVLATSNTTVLITRKIIDKWYQIVLTVICNFNLKRYLDLDCGILHILIFSSSLSLFNLGSSNKDKDLSWIDTFQFAFMVNSIGNCGGRF